MIARVGRIALAWFMLSGAAAAGEWIGRWGIDAASCRGSDASAVLHLDRKSFDLSMFEAWCSVGKVSESKKAYSFSLKCQGEGGTDSRKLSLRVSGDRLEFLNGGFNPKRFVRCSR